MLNRLHGASLAVATLIAAGIGLLVVAAFNTDYPACAPGETGVARVGADGGTYGTCGVDPVPFLIAGLALLVIGGALAILRLHERRQP